MAVLQLTAFGIEDPLRIEAELIITDLTLEPQEIKFAFDESNSKLQLFGQPSEVSDELTHEVEITEDMISEYFDVLKDVILASAEEDVLLIIATSLSSTPIGSLQASWTVETADVKLCACLPKALAVLSSSFAQAEDYLDTFDRHTNTEQLKLAIVSEKLKSEPQHQKASKNALR